MAERPAGGWRPIEYYDGSFSVLLYDPNVGPFVGGKDAYGWFIHGDNTQYHDGDLNPTHWADLPAAP